MDRIRACFFRYPLVHTIDVCSRPTTAMAHMSRPILREPLSRPIVSIDTHTHVYVMGPFHRRVLHHHCIHREREIIVFLRSFSFSVVVLWPTSGRTTSIHFRPRRSSLVWSMLRGPLRFTRSCMIVIECPRCFILHGDPFTLVIMTFDTRIRGRGQAMDQ